MIHINRSSVPAPESLFDKRVEQLRRQLVERFSSDIKTRQQSRTLVRFEVWRRPDVLEAMTELFHSKCAYCEQPAPKFEREHHRPFQNARDLKGNASPDHYWWLAYEWENMYASCSVCNRNKSSMFPTEGERVSADISKDYYPKGDALREERPLLLDPCVDYPEEFFIFAESGEVLPSGKSSKFNQRRASATIKIIGLNRSDLVAARREMWQRTDSMLDKRSVEALMEILSLNTPFLQTTCWRIGHWLALQGITVDSPEYPSVDVSSVRLGRLSSRSQKGDGFVSSLLTALQENTLLYKAIVTSVAYHKVAEKRLPEKAAPSRSKAKKKAKKKTTRAKQPAPSAGVKVSVTSDAEIVSTAEHITRVTIENFRAIETLELEFASGYATEESALKSQGEETSVSQPWHVLLGDNGIGKSSVLQAIGLVLLGETGIKELNRDNPIDWSSILRRAPKGTPQPRKGKIELLTSRSSTPITLTFTKSGFKYQSAGSSGRTYVRGYGPQRLIPRDAEATDSYMAKPMEVGNLFDPWVPLRDPQKWLLSIERDEDFYMAALTLKDLLNIDGDGIFERRDGKIWIRDDNNILIRLNELSSGYQAVLTLAVDIMAGIYDSLKQSGQSLADINSLGGIILLDELGAYLHPTWRKMVVAKLKRAFPGFQFLAMTHEPLCMWGLHKEEVTVLKRVEGDLISMSGDDLPSPRDMRVDQILTSHLFGMDSTIDPETETLFNEYYDLLALSDAEKKRRGKSCAERIEELRDRLEGVGALGYTRRDQVLYEAIDRGLAREAIEKDAQVRKQLRNNLLDEVRKIWSTSAKMYKNLNTKR